MRAGTAALRRVIPARRRSSDVAPACPAGPLFRERGHAAGPAPTCSRAIPPFSTRPCGASSIAWARRGVCTATATLAAKSMGPAKWTWPDDTGHMREVISPHLSCVQKYLKIKAFVKDAARGRTKSLARKSAEIDEARRKMWNCEFPRVHSDVAESTAKLWPRGGHRPPTRRRSTFASGGRPIPAPGSSGRGGSPRRRFVRRHPGESGKTPTASLGSVQNWK